MKSWLSRALLGVLVLIVARAEAQLPPAKAEKALKAVDGLNVALWASEPLFTNPTAMDVDPLGRVWVCEAVNYRNRLRGFKTLTRPEGDRIVILEDSKGTGKADRATTFYQAPELLAPLGIAVAKDPVGPGWKVFLCQSPDILVLEDRDGDGKADGPPVKLLTGFGGVDHDHGIHGILIGPDRKLYFSVGDTGVHNLQSADGKGKKWSSNSTDCRAGTIWRCDLDGTNLQLIAHNFRNEYEPCVDSFGNVFVSDNDDDGNQQTRICFVMPGGDYGYHPRGRGESHWHEEQPGVVPKILRTFFGSPTGMCVYEGGLLPKKYQGHPLHTDAGPRHVRSYGLTPQGAGYAVEREDIVSSGDNWFRPSDVCVAPDGSVLVADWYDPGVGGHGMGDITRGRIYRITPTGHAASSMKFQGDLGSSKGLLAALASPALAVRYQAMARLDAMPKADAVKVLRPAAEQKADAVLRARALWQLARIGGRDAAGDRVFGLLDDADPRFQALAVRLAKESLNYSADELAALASGLARGKADPAVLRECLLALRDQEPAKVKSALYELMKRYDGKDRFYLAAVGIAVGHHDAARRELLLADFASHFSTWNEQLAGLIWELRPTSVLPLLEKRLVDATVPADQRAQIADVVATSPDPQAGRIMVRLLTGDVPAEVRERAAEHLKTYLPTRWQKLRGSKELAEAVRSLLARPESRLTALALITAAERKEAAGDVLRLASDAKEVMATRRAAATTLGALPTVPAVDGLAGLLRSGPAEVQSAAAMALGELTRLPGSADVTKKAVDALTGLLADANAPPVVRELSAAALAAGRPGSQWLLEAHAKGKLPADVVATAGRVLRNSPYRDLQNKALVAFPAPGKLNLARLPAIPVLATRKGNLDRGKKLFEASAKSNLQCLKCHTVRGAGGHVGPDLSMIGKKASRDNLFESILYPSKAIADQFVTWVVETNKGLVLQGLIVEETAEALVLRDAEGRDTRVAKNDIDSRTKGPKSLMSDDLAVHFSEEELIDLVEYLLTLRTASLTVTGWHVIGPFDNGGGMEGLDRVYPPEKGYDPKGSYAGKHDKVSWRTVRATANGYVDLLALHGAQAPDSVSYLTQEIESPADQEATVLLGSDDGAKVWVNSALVHTSRMTRAAAPEQDTFKVRLRKGTNRVLLKINNGDGPHGLYFTLLSEQEVKAVGR